MIIGIVGEKLAGKDTAADYLAEKYGAKRFRFSLLLDEILSVLNLPISRENEIKLGMGLREIFGPHTLVEALGSKIKRVESEFIVVNGIRMDEMDTVRSWGAKIIYVTAPVEMRFERDLKRREKMDDGQKDLESFKQDDLLPTEKDIPALGAKADTKIENTGTLEEFYKKLDQAFAALSGQ